jgi:hypothetical protein
MTHTPGVLQNMFRVNDAGDVFATTYNTGGADFAEAFSVKGSKIRLRCRRRAGD